MADWTWSIGPGASAPNPGPTRELTAANARILTRRVDGHPYAQFQIDGRSDEIAELQLRESDLWCWRDGVLVFRGRIVGAQSSIDPTKHHVQFQAIGYRGMLTEAARIEPTVPSWTNTDQAVIAWQLVQHRQAQTGGNWGITQGVGSSSAQNRDLTAIVAGTPVGEAIDRIARLENGFEWDINPTMQLDRWFPQRGVNLGVVLDYGGLLSHVNEGTPQFGNAAVATGDESTNPAMRQTTDVATDPRGRWTVSQGFPSVSQQSTVNAKAVWLRDQASTIDRQWTVEFAPGRWAGDDHVGLGDIVRLQVDDGWVQVDGPHRVVELQVVPGDHGTETVRAGLVGVGPGAPEVSPP